MPRFVWALLRLLKNIARDLLRRFFQTAPSAEWNRCYFGEAIEVDFKKLGEVHQKLNVQIGGFAAL